MSSIQARSGLDQPEELDFSPAVRNANLERLAHDEYDLLVVGGGVTGTGIARDAALRGFKTALIEKNDYASGTSSKSSRLIHGGLRYLEQFEFALVFEACQERRVLRRIAPHMVSALPFIMPVYAGSVRPYWQIRLGMWLYDCLALFRNVKLHRALDARQLLDMEPMVSPAGLKGGPRFYDCSVDDARLTLTNALSAARAGAVAVNHTRVTGLLKANGKVCGVQVRDEITGKEMEVRSKIVAGAAGPWGDSLLKMDDRSTPDNLRPTKGVHLMVNRDRIGNCNALSYLVQKDGRLMFLIPWGKFSIVGTTDTDYRGRPEDLAVEASDVDYTLDAFNHAFPTVKLTDADIISAYVGLRPLVAENASTESKISREHRIFLPESGLITIAGGKLTTYRVMAKQVVDIAEKRLGKDFGIRAKQGCVTDHLALEGGAGGGLHAQVVHQVEAATTLLNLGDEEASCLLTTYGTGYTRLINLVKSDPALGKRICPTLPYLWAELPHSVRNEMALSLCDFMIRRTHIICEDPSQGMDQAPEVAEKMGALLGWSAEEKVRQLAAYAHEVDLTRKFRT
jgi:glycerol-3-phosphate dehydrogenase